MASGGWVTDPAGDQPHCVPLVVRAVPDSPAAGNFILPLLEGARAHGSRRQIVSQPALALVPAARVNAKLLPTRLGRPSCTCAQLLPTVGGFAGTEAELPLTGGCGWSYPLPPALWTPRAHGAGTGRPSAWPVRSG